MAIRNRRGNLLQFDKSRLLSGEFAYVLDTGELFYCYGANQVKKLATEEDLQDILDASSSSYTALLQLIEDLETNPSEITNILSNISDLEDEDIAIYQSISALELKFNNAILLANKSVYISPTGSDTTGNGSSGSPYKTIAKCNSVTPKNLNGYGYNVFIASGTYTEEISFVGFGGGRVAVNLQGNVTLNGSIIIVDSDSSIQIQSTTGNLFTLTINNTLNSVAGIQCSNSKFINFASINIIETSNSFGISAYGGSICYFTNSVTINNTSVAVATGSNAHISFQNALTGTGNTVGIRVNTGIISYDQSQFTLSATTLKEIIDGGIITNDLVVRTDILKPTTLWTNPSPTSSFAGQTVTLSETIANFQFYEVEYAHDTTSNNNVRYTSNRRNITELTRLGIFSSQFGYRNVPTPPSTTNFYFSDGITFVTYAGTSSTNNALAIPIRIIGYK